MTWPFGNLRPLNYEVIVADPPWHYDLYSAKGEAKAPQAQYATMPLADIKALPVDQLATKGCVLFLWATAPLLPEAIEVLRAWRFTFITAAAWGKRSKTGQKQAFGTGYVYRSAAEFWLVGKLGEPPQSRSRSIRNCIDDTFLSAPVREHSRKPDEFYDGIAALFPGARCLELFARTQRPGWDCWGNETEKFAA